MDPQMFDISSLQPTDNLHIPSLDFLRTYDRTRRNELSNGFPEIWGTPEGELLIADGNNRIGLALWEGATQIEATYRRIEDLPAYLLEYIQDTQKRARHFRDLGINSMYDLLQLKE